MVIGQKHYVISLHSDGTHEVEICSDANEVILRCSSILCNDSKTSLFIDVGFLWPQVKDFLEILQKHPGEIVISQHASNALAEIPTCHKVGSYFVSDTGGNISVQLVDREFSRNLCDPISLLNFCPEWILEEKISDLAELPTSIQNKLGLYEIEYVLDLLEYPTGSALLYLECFEKKDLSKISESIIKSIKRGNVFTRVDTNKASQVEPLSISNQCSSISFKRWIIDADVSDPIAILQRAPRWLLESEILSLVDIPTRFVHRCAYRGISNTSDLLKYTSDSILRWDGVGEVSLKKLSDSIIATVKSHGDERSDKLVEVLFDAPDNPNIPFEKWIESADYEDPITILNHSPEWILELDATTLINLPVRLKNRLEGQKIEKVEDLLKHSSYSILKWPDVGLKSLVQLSNSIIATITTGQVVGLKDGESTDLADNTSLQDLFNSALNTLTSREAEVLKMRLGYNLNKAMTLEEIGREFTVTRERIRQIEVKAKSKLKSSPLWRDGIIESRITYLMSSRVEPCYLDLISLEDNWFEGFSRDTKCLGALIEDASKKKFKYLSIGDRGVISKIDSESWRQAKLEVTSILEARLSSQLTKGDVLLLIESYLGKFEAQELTSTLFSKISSQLHFIPSEEGTDELASIGRGANSIVLPVLKASSTPLHYSEVHSRCLAMGYEMDICRVHNALADISYLFSLGTYGLRKHLQLTKNEEIEILSQLEDIILSGDPERQWNSSVLVDLLCDQYPGIPDMLDNYAVNIILKNSKLLSSLGRSIWVRSEHAKKQNINRIDIQVASTALIEKKGRAMSTSELKARIMKQRGMSEYFSLKVTDSIARVSPTVWGLVDRDFYLNRNQIIQLLDLLHASFFTENKGLYIDEARLYLKKKGQFIPEKLTNHMIFSLAQTDSRFTIRKGQLLGLSEWPNAKRLTIREASCKAALELNEFSCSTDIRSRVEELIERKFSVNNQLNTGIQDAGFIYNELKKKWVLGSSEQGETKK